jgi:hypothetical protein
MNIDLYDLFLFQGEPDMKNVIDASIKQALTMHGDGLPQGEIQILHATPEQISQLQQAHHIQILQGDQIIQHHFLMVLSIITYIQCKNSINCAPLGLHKSNRVVSENKMKGQKWPPMGKK